MQEILDLLQNDARLTAEDIATMIKTGQRARNRGGLKGIPSQAPQYWAFP